MLTSVEVGDKVLVRTYSAGVHFGTYLGREGKEVLLGEGRRLWSWQGALSLSEIAVKGVDLANSKISVAVPKVLLTEAIELLPISKDSNIWGL